MVFLILQMAFLLIIALSLGVILGWWLNNLQTKQAIADATPTFDTTQTKQFALNSQLNKCLDENIVLRQDLKMAEKKLIKGTGQSGENDNPQEENLKEKFNVLLGDLQIRDDTISSLCKEIKNLKGDKGHSDC